MEQSKYCFIHNTVTIYEAAMDCFRQYQVAYGIPDRAGEFVRSG